jgi:HAD superfamily hydrolase (TIGR01458 family)
MGFHINPEDVFSSLSAAPSLILKENLRPMLFLESDALIDFQGISTQDPNAVVIGLAPSQFTYEKLNDAFRLIQHGCRLIAIHKGRYFADGSGLNLGPGAFVTALEYACGTQATVVGKPEPSFFQLALGHFNAKPEECIMIGDDLKDDVEAALTLGMQAFLVRTGKYKSGDEFKGIHPTKTFDSFADAVSALMSECDTPSI